MARSLVKLNWLTLKFLRSENNLEHRFQEKYLSSNIKHVRACHLYTMAFYTAAGYIDYLFFPETLRWLFFIRFLIVIPIFILGYFFTFSRHYKQTWQLISFFYILLTGGSFIAFMAIANPPMAYDYYLGIIFCMVFGYTFIRERFIYASAAGLILLIVYLLVSVFIINLPKYYMILSTFYLVLLNGLGMIISRHSEISARKDFYLEYMLFMEKEKVIDLNNSLDEKIQERTKSLIDANKNLKQEILDRKRIEKKLRETQRTFEVLFNEAPDAIFLESMDDKILDANLAASQMLGYTVDEFKQMTVFDLLPPEKRASESGIIKKELTMGELFEGVDLHKNGRRIPVEINNHRTIIDDQKIVLSIVRDISKRKEIEEALNKNKQRIQSIFRAAPIGIGLVVNREIVEVNERLVEMTGYAKTELIGKNARILYPTDQDYESVGDEKYRQIQKYGTGTVETRFKLKNGNIIDILMTSTPLDPSDWTKGVSFTALDITEKKKAEKEFQIVHQRFLTVLDSIDATIYVADMDTYEILFMNRHMIKDFGSDFTGETCWKAFRGAEKPCPDCYNEKLVDSEGNPADVYVWQGENPITQKSYINHDRAIQWTDGRLVRLQIATDITELKKMEAQLRQAQKMESVGRLAGGVAHDFNNMLSIILGNTEMILEDLEDTHPVVHNLNEIYKAAERSSNLTRQLLAFARKQTISPEKIDLNHAIEGMLKMIMRLIGEDINLAWLPQKNLWSVKIDPSQIDQILANLCVNARDAIKDVGKITIETDNISFDKDYCHEHDGFRPGDYVMIALSDNGCGMDKEILTNLFEPFFTTKDVGKGTGLGLATIYGIIKQNNGFINVYSEVDRGTTFRLYFPRHAGKVPRTEKSELEKIDKTGHETILVVEDEAAILEMTTMMLERLGYKVLAASDPFKALEMGHAYPEKINLLMTDIVMPGMNGRDLSKKMNQLFPNLKWLFMSGYTANVIAHHGVLDDGVQFIQKPFSRQDLASTVRDILDENKASKRKSI
jgi:PAS domain S-box-containing protein